MSLIYNKLNLLFLIFCYKNILFYLCNLFYFFFNEKIFLGYLSYLFYLYIGRVVRVGREGYVYFLVVQDEVFFFLDLYIFLGRFLIIVLQFKNVEGQRNKVFIKKLNIWRGLQIVNFLNVQGDIYSNFVNLECKLQLWFNIYW